jgi:hypothetical protein
VLRICPNTSKECGFPRYCAQLQRAVEFPNPNQVESFDGQPINELPSPVTSAILGVDFAEQRLELLRQFGSNRIENPRVARVANNIAEIIGHQRTHVAV